jgi:hypothetical protein
MAKSNTLSDRSIPLDPDASAARTKSHNAIYRPAHSVDEQPLEAWEKKHNLVEYAITQEDYWVVETGQENLKYPPDCHRNLLGRTEIALQHFHRYLADFMARH